MTKIHDAIIFATIAHQNQKRKGTDIPYIVHPMEVMQILTDMQCKESVIIAGVLHDTLEDTDATESEIKDLFGEEVLSIVKMESEDKTKTWKERKQHTIDSLKNDPVETVLVCLADKLSNIRSMYANKETIGDKLWDRFNADVKSIEWYYRNVADVIMKTPIKDSCNLQKAVQYTMELTDTIIKVFSI